MYYYYYYYVLLCKSNKFLYTHLHPPYGPQYRAWLRDSFQPGPSRDEEQVGALLLQLAEQQRPVGPRRATLDHSWMKDDTAGSSLSSDHSEEGKGPSSDKS